MHPETPGWLHPPSLIGYASNGGMQGKARSMEQNLSFHAFEYAVGLVTVIIGLAVVDLATSFHKLARHRGSVTWDPLVLFAALYSLLLAITMWFKIWSIRDVAAIGHYLFYLTLCAEFFLLFMVAAASLPDDPNETCDLRSYYGQSPQATTPLVSASACLIALGNDGKRNPMGSRAA